MKYIYIIVLVFLINSVNSKCQWQRVYRHYENQGLQQYDLSCADEMNCISVASPGATGSMFIKTTDGGYNWFVQLADSAKYIYNDEGQWTDVEGPKFKPARCIDYVTPSFAVAGHTEGQITITRDGGVSWDSINLNTNSDIKKIQFTDENFGVVFAYQEVFKTYDGGYNWEIIDLKYQKGRDTWELNMFVVGIDSLIIISYDRTDTNNTFRTIFKTTDGGESWNAGNKIPEFRYFDPFFTDMKNGWLAGNINTSSNLYSDLIYYTSDGGETWETQLDTLLYPQRGLTGIYFLNKKEGIAWGEGFKIWRTTDGGNNWIHEDVLESISSSFNKIVFPNNNFDKRIANTYLSGEIWMYEDLTSVNEFELKFDNINVFPNPTSDFLTISISNNGLQPIVHKVRIFDVLGIEVMSESIHPMTSSHRMNVEKLPAGVYFIRIGDKLEKFVKM
ncbi:MAG: T9SS type A sorting domain-containing protein [Candidatus Kapabacteria bacterium]|jgi:photosystem II stability/assembly factor-like uncharacterized protein|nr:T9SS type A sorting domain-containing protein [Candidatus Kapabacteria bacterium]